MIARWWVSPAWAASMTASGVNDFASAWALCKAPLDGLNHRQNGWAAVHRVQLPGAPERPAVFLKQQSNYRTRSFRNPVAGEAVAEREMRNLRAFVAEGICVPELICYGADQVDGEPCTLLGLAELQGYLPLDESLAQSGVDADLRDATIRGAGELIGILHRKRWEFRCLYPKHVFVCRQEDAPPMLAFIDLEKARKRIRARYGAIRDLSTFLNRCPDWDAQDREHFMQAYLGEFYTPEQAGDLLAKVSERNQARGHA